MRATTRDALDLARDRGDLDELLAQARNVRERAWGGVVTYSPKVFIPLTALCRDVCHYCTFAHPPRRGQRAFLTIDEVLAIARAGAAAGCREALFTLGDKPELRYRVAREELAELGHETTASYLVEAARAVLEETGLLPHANPGILDDDELAAVRTVAPSQGIMLETASARLSERGMPHFGSPDKAPDVRLDALERAGRLRIPYTSGILIGIGETRTERVEALLALRDLHLQHGHLQEVIVQNFRAKAGHEDGRRARAVARRPPVDDRRRAADPARRGVAAGAAEPGVRRLPAAARGRHQRLGRRLARDAGPRQPRGALARPRPARRRHRRRRPDAAAAARGVPALPARPGHLARSEGRAVGERRGRRPRSRAPGGGVVHRRVGRHAAVVVAAPHRRRLGRLRRGARGHAPHAGAGHGAARGARPGGRPAGRRGRPRCAPSATATRSPTSSAGTSTTPTSATSSAASAPSRRASWPRTCAGPPTCSAATRSFAAATRRGSAAAPRCACRAASIPASPASGTSSWSRRSGPSCPTCTSTRSRRSRSGRARTPPRCRCATTWRACATPGSARCPAPRPRSSTTTCGARCARTRCRRRSGSR